MLFNGAHGPNGYQIQHGHYSRGTSRGRQGEELLHRNVAVVLVTFAAHNPGRVDRQSGGFHACQVTGEALVPDP